MRAAVGGANLVLGAAYLVIGMLVLVDLARGARTLGFSRFGAALAGLAFTCGPHHLVHGIHVAFEGRGAYALDLVVVAVGLVPGAGFAFLRLEAFAGRRGDRFVSGTPAWVISIPAVASAYVTGVTAVMVGIIARGVRMHANLVPHVLLVVIYAAIALVLARSQISNRRDWGGWSTSGMSLTGLFASCALMHATFAVYAASGAFSSDAHSALAAMMSVPAGIYFLLVVRALHHDQVHDWNRRGDRMAVPTAGVT